MPPRQFGPVSSRPYESSSPVNVCPTRQTTRRHPHAAPRPPGRRTSVRLLRGSVEQRHRQMWNERRQQTSVPPRDRAGPRPDHPARPPPSRSILLHLTITTQLKGPPAVPIADTPQAPSMFDGRAEHLTVKPLSATVDARPDQGHRHDHVAERGPPASAPTTPAPSDSPTTTICTCSKDTPGAPTTRSANPLPRTEATQPAIDRLYCEHEGSQGSGRDGEPVCRPVHGR